MTSSAGTSGLILLASPPRSAIASRMAARSTTAGTPVKSCMTTRAGVKAISSLGSALASQRASFSTSAACTEPLPSVRSRFSSSTLRLNGKRDQRSVDEPDAEVAFDARDLERLAQGIRPPPHLVRAPLEVLPHPRRHEAPGTPLHHVIHLGEGKRCGDEIIVD